LSVPASNSSKGTSRISSNSGFLLIMVNYQMRYRITRFDTKPTVISMADVVEHEAFPLESLRCARELINYPGMLLISMPNASAPLWHSMNAANQNPYRAEINHFHNFTRENLYAALKKTGFRPIHYNISERYRCCMEVLAEAE